MHEWPILIWMFQLHLNFFRKMNGNFISSNNLSSEKYSFFGTCVPYSFSLLCKNYKSWRSFIIIIILTPNVPFRNSTHQDSYKLFMHMYLHLFFESLSYRKGITLSYFSIYVISSSYKQKKNNLKYPKDFYYIMFSMIFTYTLHRHHLAYSSV